MHNKFQPLSSRSRDAFLRGIHPSLIGTESNMVQEEKKLAGSAFCVLLGVVH